MPLSTSEFLHGIFASNDMEAKLCSFLLCMCESNEGAKQREDDACFAFCHKQQRYLS